jgi:Txe/YoeB family toxin of Txe-Axe toxin-antitoxin module
MKPIPLGYAKVKTKYGYVRKGYVDAFTAPEAASGGDGDDSEKTEPDAQTGYPELYLHDAPEALLDLPAQGKATIEFKVQGRTSSEHKGDDGKMKACVDVCLEIVSITPEGASKEPEPLKASPRDAFSRWSKEHS